MKLFGNSHETPEQEIRVQEISSADGGTAAADGAGKKKKTRRTLIILGAVALAILAAVAAYAIWERPPEISSAPENTPHAAVTARPGGNAAQPGGAEPGDTEPVDEGEAPAVPMTSDRRAGVYTFLLVGVDRASNSTDTIMVVSFDTAQHTISCTSIPRDTLVNIGWANTPKKINAVYPGYLNSGADGITGLKGQVKNLLGFDVDSYVVVYLQAVEDAVDAIGGVWFDVPQDMIYEDYVQDLYIDIKAGYQKLNGADALKLCRFRDGYAGGDLQRIGVQQSFLKALATQLISLGSIPHLGELIDVLLQDVDTDLTAANLAWLARQFLACKSENITFQTAPLSGAGSGINDVSIVGLDVGSWLAMVNDSINPYEDDVTVSNVNILTFGYGGGYVGATTGVIAGGPDSFYCLSCTSKSGAVVWHAPGAHLSFGEETGPGTETEDPGEGETEPGPGEEDPAGGPEIVTPEPGEEPEITE